MHHRRRLTSMPGETNDYPARPVAASPSRGSLRPKEGTPPPPRRSRQSRNQIVTFLNFMLSSVVFIILLGGAVFYFGNREFTRPGPTVTTETVNIRPNTGTREIANLLQREGIIRSEEHTSELQSRENLVCRLLLEKKKVIWRTVGAS